jgi:hypothetical protein
MNPELENRLRNTTRNKTRIGHIFGPDNYSICWGPAEWGEVSDGWRSTSEWFYPGITRPQSVGLDDEGLVCYYCAEKARKHLKPKVSP